MKKLATVICILLIVALIVTGSFLSKCVDTYNTLVKLDEQVNLQYAQIQTNLQRRMDLIPAFVETVKGAAEHEEAVFTEIAQARSTVIATMESGNIANAEDAIANYENTLNRCLEVIVENYPELTAGDNFTALQDELAGTENRINVARQYYNEAVEEYNIVCRSFPAIIFAKMAGFEPAESFEASLQAETAPTFDFSS